MSGAARQGSIRGRLLALLLCGAAGLAVLLFLVVQIVARQVAQESQDNILAASALSVMDSARSADGEILVDIPYAALSMLDSVTDERVFYAVRLGDELLTGYGALPRPPLGDMRRPGFLSAGFLGEEVRIAAVRRPFSTDQGRSYVEVSIAQTRNGQRRVLARLSRLAAASGAGFFGFSAVMALIVARSATRPLDRLAASVARRGPQDLRPVAAPVPLEMAPLVTALNGFMARLESSLARSEEFIAEAAHRVRTPLAVVRTKAEIIQRNVASPENRRAIAEMIHAIDDSSRTAGQLLDHAMVAFRLDNLEARQVDLFDLVEDSLDRLRPVAGIKNIALQVSDAAPVSVPGDPILLQSALHNLLDNAIKYSPPGARVDLALRQATGGGAVLSVSDTGPGFPPGAPGALAERFARGGNAGAVVGSGLGLTIARDVIAAHGGRLVLDNNPGGGACASLHFPSA